MSGKEHIVLVVRTCLMARYTSNDRLVKTSNATDVQTYFGGGLG